jgi:hypothetical protein
MKDSVGFWLSSVVFWVWMIGDEGKDMLAKGPTHVTVIVILCAAWCLADVARDVQTELKDRKENSNE